MILTGKKIVDEFEEGVIHIAPFQLDQVNPNSYDVRLGGMIATYKKPSWFRRVLQWLGLSPRERVSARESNEITYSVIPREGMILDPGELYLGHTEEYVGTEKYVSIVDGKSSVGRLGLFVHVTAGYVDVGFKGQITLELVATIPIRIFPGMRIAQLRYLPCDGEVTLYRGNYQGTKAEGPVPSMSWNQR